MIRRNRTSQWEKIEQVDKIYSRGGSPHNGLYGEAPPDRGTFSGGRYVKG